LHPHSRWLSKNFWSIKARARISSACVREKEKKKKEARARISSAWVGIRKKRKTKHVVKIGDFGRSNADARILSAWVGSSA
jgi:hypothetical protein